MASEPAELANDAPHPMPVRGMPTTTRGDDVNATCPDCGWTMPADDEAEAEILLEVHRIVKMQDAYEEGT